MPSTPQDLVYAIVNETNETTVTFAQLLQKIHTSQFTGPITFHFRRGTPQKVEFHQPLTLLLGPQT